jgi:hypothetical protein
MVKNIINKVQSKTKDNNLYFSENKYKFKQEEVRKKHFLQLP